MKPLDALFTLLCAGIIALVLWVNHAKAEQCPVPGGAKSCNLRDKPSITIHNTGQTTISSSPREIFRMSEGACLRGPLYFIAADGSKIFELQAGIDYPTGCAKGETK